jgi:glutathione S-transferase
MAFRLHGFPQSTCTRRVAHIARERGIPYEVVPVNPAVGEHKQPQYLAHQPFGQVPYVVVRRRLSLFPPAAVAAAY